MGEQMKTEKLRIAELGERIINLKVEQVPHSAAGHVGQTAARGQRREHAAVTIGTQGQPISALEQEPSSADLDGGHLGLAEDMHLIRSQSEMLLLREIVDRLGVS